LIRVNLFCRVALASLVVAVAVVAGVDRLLDAQSCDEKFVGIQAGVDLAGRGGGVKEVPAHGDQAVDEEPFDFHGAHIDLIGAFGNPKPVQHPHPPMLIAGRSAAVLRVVAEHANLWNIAGGDIADASQRSALLDRYCTEIGRDPDAITRSIHLHVSYDQPDTTRDAIGEALDAGFTHVTLGLPAQPYPANVARWVAEELIAKSVDVPRHRRVARVHGFSLIT